jgi:hypothetical protein
MPPQKDFGKSLNYLRFSDIILCSLKKELTNELMPRRGKTRQAGPANQEKKIQQWHC